MTVMPSPGSFIDPDRLAGLRRAVAAIPVADIVSPCQITPLEIPEIDGVLPEGGLCSGRLHAVLTGDCRDHPAALGFAAALACRLAGTGRILWISAASGRSGPGDFGQLYAPGLVSLGLDPDRIILVSTRRQDEMLWALEQGLTCPELALAVGEVDPKASLTLTAARRLQLAAARSGVAALLVGGHAGREDGMVAAVTRWCVAAAPAPKGANPLPYFEVSLNARGAKPAHWQLAWDSRQCRFHLAETIRYARIPRDSMHFKEAA